MDSSFGLAFFSTDLFIPRMGDTACFPQSRVTPGGAFDANFSVRLQPTLEVPR